MLALKSGSRTELSVVSRVRQLLTDVNAVLSFPGSRGDPESWSGTQGRAAASRDLDEIESRLHRLRSLFPELEGVEAGPLVGHARKLLREGALGPKRKRFSK